MNTRTYIAHHHDTTTTEVVVPLASAWRMEDTATRLAEDASGKLVNWVEFKRTR